MSKKGQQTQYTIGRIMLTFTFLDDALRVYTEWGSHVDYMGGQLGPLLGAEDDVRACMRASKHVEMQKCNHVSAQACKRMRASVWQFLASTYVSM